MEAARKLINAAQQGILFLFFEPGAFEQDQSRWTLLQSILDRHDSTNPSYSPNLSLCGVVNQAIAGLTTDEPAGKKSTSPSIVLPLIVVNVVFRG